MFYFCQSLHELVWPKIGLQPRASGLSPRKAVPYDMKSGQWAGDLAQCLIVPWLSSWPWLLNFSVKSSSWTLFEMDFCQKITVIKVALAVGLGSASYAFSISLSTLPACRKSFENLARNTSKVSAPSKCLWWYWPW